MNVYVRSIKKCVREKENGYVEKMSDKERGWKRKRWLIVDSIEMLNTSKDK